MECIFMSRVGMVRAVQCVGFPCDYEWLATASNEHWSLVRRTQITGPVPAPIMQFYWAKWHRSFKVTLLIPFGAYDNFCGYERAPFSDHF